MRLASLIKIFFACDFTVSGAMPNDFAIRLLDIPLAIICRICVSRRVGVRQATCGGAGLLSWAAGLCDPRQVGVSVLMVSTGQQRGLHFFQ